MHKTIPTILLTACVLFTGGWGPRGHMAANRAAVNALPAELAFLRPYTDWIAETGPLPDSWRGASEPYSKIFEDPNHGWFKEQFAFMKEIPRNRYEFVIRLYDEYLRVNKKDPEAAKLLNVRWTGTMPYAAMENYDRMKSAMRLYRATADENPSKKFLAQDIAFYMGWLGHYTADGAQPLHDSIHHDGWLGPNPKNYTRDPRIHGRFESQFVDLIQLSEGDLKPAEAQVLTDPFAAFVAHLDDASVRVEEVYQLDAAGAFAERENRQAKALAVRQLTRAAALLRDLVYTAWVESGKPANRSAGPDGNPILPAHPRYNPETGTAPPGPGLPARF